MTDDPVVTVRILMPVGPLTFMGVPIMLGATMVLQGLPAQDQTSNTVGPGNLMVIAHAVMEGMGLGGLVIAGALRATGADPGHRPRDIRFARRVRAAFAGRLTPQLSGLSDRRLFIPPAADLRGIDFNIIHLFAMHLLHPIDGGGVEHVRPVLRLAQRADLGKGVDA
jgi:hypothetical protein